MCIRDSHYTIKFFIPLPLGVCDRQYISVNGFSEYSDSSPSYFISIPIRFSPKLWLHQPQILAHITFYYFRYGIFYILSIPTFFHLLTSPSRFTNHFHPHPQTLHHIPFLHTLPSTLIHSFTKTINYITNTHSPLILSHPPSSIFNIFRYGFISCPPMVTPPLSLSYA